MLQVYIICAMFILTFSSPLLAITDVKDFIKLLNEDIEQRNNLNITSSTDNLEIIEKLYGDGFDYFKQSATIQKLTGIKDSQFKTFLNFFFTKIIFPEPYKKILNKSLMNITDEYSLNWQSYEFIYHKHSTNTSHYISVLAQHDYIQQKVNLVYTNIDTYFQMTDVLIISNIKHTYLGFVQDVDIVRIPVEYDGKDVRIILDFFRNVSLKAFANFYEINLEPEEILRRGFGKKRGKGKGSGNGKMRKVSNEDSTEDNSSIKFLEN